MVNLLQERELPKPKLQGKSISKSVHQTEKIERLHWLAKHISKWKIHSLSKLSERILISKEETIATTQPLNGNREYQTEQRDSTRSNINVSQRERETKQVIYMLILIMVLFFTCWAPLLIFNVLAAFGHLGPGNTAGNEQWSRPL